MATKLITRFYKLKYLNTYSCYLPNLFEPCTRTKARFPCQFCALVFEFTFYLFRVFWAFSSTWFTRTSTWLPSVRKRLPRQQNKNRRIIKQTNLPQYRVLCFGNAAWLSCTSRNWKCTYKWSLNHSAEWTTKILYLTQDLHKIIIIITDLSMGNIQPLIHSRQSLFKSHLITTMWCNHSINLIV
jgi:hypothetical protein